MQKTQISWVINPDGSRPGWSWNPITGCLNGCSYCYAFRLANTRLRKQYLDNDNVALDPRYSIRTTHTNPFHPRLWTERLHNPFRQSGSSPALSGNRDHLIQGRGIFVCDMGDLFGEGVPPEWTERVMRVIRSYEYHRFYLLTKQPQNLAAFSPFPPNAWVGVSATDTRMAMNACVALRHIEATVKYLSLEPLLGPVNLPAQLLRNCGIEWLIIGSQTKPTVLPKRSWCDEIIESARQTGVAVFQKNSLSPLYPEGLIQEWPKATEVDL